MIPSNSGRVPISYQGNPRRNLPCQSNRLIGHLASIQWTDHRITTQDHFQKQYSYSSRSFSQEPTLQKQNPMSSVSFQVKIVNLQILHWHLSQSRLQLYHHINIQLLKLTKDLLLMTVDMQASLCRVPTVLLNNFSVVPQSQEMHLPEMRKDFCRDFNSSGITWNENFRHGKFL